MNLIYTNPANQNTEHLKNCYNTVQQIMQDQGLSKVF